MDLQKDEDFEKAWQENRHIWESTKNLAKAMFYAGQAKAKAVPDGFVLVPKEPYAYLVKHKFWQKGSDPEIFLAEEFLGDDGVEKDKLTVCIPLYLGDDEAQEQK